MMWTHIYTLGPGLGLSRERLLKNVRKENYAHLEGVNNSLSVIFYLFTCFMSSMGP